MKFGVLLSLVSLVACRILPACTGTVRVRKNLRDMTGNEMERYFSAVRKLNSGTRPTRWDMYANIHLQEYPKVHNSPLFLVWHRMMLYAIERDLQVHDANVTIPYWDWTSFAQRPQADPVLSSRLFGGSGNPRTGCVRDGKFTDFEVFYWHSGQQSEHCLRRNSNIFQRPFTSSVVIDRNYLDLRNIRDFAQAIEGVPHSTVHNNVGGEFSGHASPGDPLFYSHHAFVDKLWFDWQNRHPKSYYSYHLSMDLPLSPWNVPVSELIDPVESLCHRYPQDRFAYNTQPRIAPFAPEKYTSLAGGSSDTDYVLKGLAPILDAANLRIPDPLPTDFITSMGFDVAKIREQERKDALLLAHSI